MKPRTKIQKEVAGLSEGIGEINRDCIEWAKENLFMHRAYKCKNEMWCSECGNMWINTGKIDDRTECPYCHRKLEVKVSRSKRIKEEIYMDVLQVAGGYQVVRHILCSKYAYKNGMNGYINENPYYRFVEIVQEWINATGKRTVIAKPINMGGNGWIYGRPMSIKDEYGNNGYKDYADVYGIYGYLYPGIQVIPELRKRGIGRRFPDVNASRVIRKLLEGGNDAELCIKTRQMEMLKIMDKRGCYKLVHKPSFNICNRNNYIIKDADMWCDYISLLMYFKKDVRNAKYVCPKNIKEEHDRLLERKKRIDEKMRRDREKMRCLERKRELKNGIEKFYKKMERFFGLEIRDDEMIIKPLESVTQFYQEGKAMHHCVYENRYYERDDCLVMSARIGEKRIETVELNLKTMEVVQSRGVCNEKTKYHERIISAVKKNRGLIRNRLYSSDSSKG